MDICNNKLKKNTNTDLILQIAAYFYTYQKSKKMVHGIIDIFPIDGRKHVFVAEEQGRKVRKEADIEHLFT